MKNIIFFLTLLLFGSPYLFSQAPDIEWQKCIGGTGADYANSIIQTSDGGYIMAGYTDSNNGDVSGNHGSLDFYIVKLNSTGIIQWQKTYGGSDIDEAKCIEQTSDGGYIVAGYTKSSDGDITRNQGMSDIWIIKLNSTGTVQWQKTYGGSGVDRANSIQKTNDGGYILVGYTNSYNGDVITDTGNGIEGLWILKLTSTGSLQWQLALGGKEGYSVKQTNDGGFIIAAISESQDINYWIIKLNSMGGRQWDKTFDGAISDDYAYSIQQTTDGGYIVVGFSFLESGTTNGHHGNSDYLVLKLNNVGIIEWKKFLGGSGRDVANSVQQTSDGGYIVAGESNSTNGDVIGNHGSNDYWIVKLNSTGIIQWQKSLGGSGSDIATAVQQTNDSGFIVAGYSSSTNRDVTNNHGSNYDNWVVKLKGSKTSNIDFQKFKSLSIQPNPIKNTQGVTLSFELDAATPINYHIYDVLGKEVQQKQLGQLSVGEQNIPINVGDLPNGIWFLSLKADNQTIVTKKFVVQR